MTLLDVDELIACAIRQFRRRNIMIDQAFQIIVAEEGVVAGDRGAELAAS